MTSVLFRSVRSCLELASDWHTAPGVATFGALLALTSVLHWGVFNHGHIAFYTWVIVYGVAPPLVVVIWWRNRAKHPGLPELDDLVVPRLVRITMVVLGWPSSELQSSPHPTGPGNRQLAVEPE